MVSTSRQFTCILLTKKKIEKLKKILPHPSFAFRPHFIFPDNVSVNKHVLITDEGSFECFKNLKKRKLEKNKKKLIKLQCNITHSILELSS